MNEIFTRRAALGILAGALAPQISLASEGSSIEWVVAFAPGGSADSTVRFLAEPMSKLMSRPLVVVNKPGGSTQIAVDYVNGNRGGNILFTADFATLATNSALYPSLRYDPDRDFVVLAMQARSPMMLLAAPNVPASNMRELAAWARSLPGGVEYGSAGVATPHHLTAELLKARTGLKLIHVPYKGSVPALQDTIGGQIPLCIADLPTALQYLLAGKMKALGIAMTKRSPNLPNVPTFIEQGINDFEVYAWQAVVVPSKMPAEQRMQIQQALLTVLDSPAVKERYDSTGLELMRGNSQQLAAFIRNERERWGRVIRENNVKID